MCLLIAYSVAVTKLMYAAQLNHREVQALTQQCGLGVNWLRGPLPDSPFGLLPIFMCGKRLLHAQNAHYVDGFKAMEACTYSIK